MSTFKIASKFKTEAEKKVEEHAILDAAWAAVPSFEEADPKEWRKKAEGLDYRKILERIING